MTASWQAADWINHGAELIRSDPFLASQLIRKGVCADPDEPLGWFNFGLALHEQRCIPQAIRAYRMSLQRPSGHEIALINNLSQDLLLNGSMAEGWTLYENRLKKMKRNNIWEQCLGASWNGLDDPRGYPDKLVLVSEQGLGDTIQFSRFGLQLQRMGFQVELVSQKSLVKLFQECSDFETVVSAFDPARHRGKVAWVPLMSLPHRLGCLDAPWPYCSEYLRIPAKLMPLVAHWHERLQRRSGHALIGLHWQGNPEHEGSIYSRGRSMPFKNFAGLIPDLPDRVEFVSLQKGAGSEQLRSDLGLPFVRGQAAFNSSMDFLDTAAVMNQCDLVISADSGVVHLAGALSIPTWVALPWIPEWRWGLAGRTSPWYSSLRLFRQEFSGDWKGVIDSMANEIGHCFCAS